jgi:hypothetical protein
MNCVIILPTECHHSGQLCIPMGRDGSGSTIGGVIGGGHNSACGVVGADHATPKLQSRVATLTLRFLY